MDRILSKQLQGLTAIPRTMDTIDRCVALEHVASTAAAIREGRSGVTRETLARERGLNPDYLGKLFKEYAGMEIREYMNRVRVARAAAMLASRDHGDRGMMQIALDAGFESLRSYYRCFRRIMGISPLEFRCTARSRSHNAFDNDPEFGHSRISGNGTNE